MMAGADTSEAAAHSCERCGETFGSRNALFRHLRSDHAAAWGPGRQTKEPSRGKAAVLFGYDAELLLSSSSSRQADSGARANVRAAALVKDSFVAACPRVLSGRAKESGKVEVKVVRTSLATEATERHPLLTQEGDCPAARDVLVVDYTALGENIDKRDDFGSKLTRAMNDVLCSPRGECGPQARAPDVVRVLAAESVPIRTQLNAEQSATQRSYHYLLPLSWLEGGREAAEWYIRTGKVVPPAPDQEQQPHETNGLVGPPPPVVVRLKKALRATEGMGKNSAAGENVPDQNHSSAVEGCSGGRFGTLGKKRPQSFHNFLGAKRPLGTRDDLPIWLTVDRAKVIDLLVAPHPPAASADAAPEVVAVVEFRGDNFVSEQVQRLIGEVVGAVNGWIPNDFHEIATDPDVSVEVPLAPSGRLYFAGTRFHFHEQSYGVLFPDDNSISDWLGLLQSRLLWQQTQSLFAKEEEIWLKGLMNVTAPQIRTQLVDVKTELAQKRMDKAFDGLIGNLTSVPDAVTCNVDRDAKIEHKEAPKSYSKVLSVLRAIAEQGEWPPTSLARSRIIRSPKGKAMVQERVQQTRNARRKKSVFPGQDLQSGAFVVVNETKYDGPLPQGNKLFPQLVNAVFELENELNEHDITIARGGGGEPNSFLTRSTSTHCAVSRNTEYVSHHDNGTGRDQCTTMIVGLGNVVGGGLCVAGRTYDILYAPLQYDGWKCSHSTEPFQGERYSLNWFSPETECIELTSEGSRQERREDIRANSLAQIHNGRLPNYPPLSFRRKSTDALVINEILDTEQGCAYEHRDNGLCFSLENHKHVLDIGAHIGVFSRYALSQGASRVTAYEPEPSNAKLLEQNTNGSNGSVCIFTSAVAHGEPGLRSFVRGTDRSDGTENTWRHSLEAYSQTHSMTEQESSLPRYSVSTVPFFGQALQPGMTFVKIDAEGAELDILLSNEASNPASWLDVTHLVYEWSFTKDRRVDIFHQATQNLKDAGFRVVYAGQGAWWDTEASVIWPYHNDHVIFAIKGN
mmetsp:Transcript_555/g.1701  ORF Transcript_555/g.1701 Transcript_555/m.1701 type:complete len:1022 (-) Transcript_555:43-3108(-)